MIITIARECGCEGDIVAGILSEELRIPYYNKTGIIELAKRHGVYAKYPRFFGEKSANSLMYTISSEDNDIAHKTPGTALEKIVGGQDCIIIGRAGNYVYKDRADCVRVFLSGDRDRRIQRIIDIHGVSHRKAEAIVEETDQRRSNYHSYYTDEEWGYAGNYDLCLSETELGAKGTVDMILNYLRCTGLLAE